MVGDCIGSFVPYTRNVHQVGFVAQSVLLKVTKPGI